nr:glycosyltransferase family 4 protein [Candidatus Cloacimonadota bacterium]
VLSRATYMELLLDSSKAMKHKAIEGFHPIEEFSEPTPDQAERRELLFFGLIKAYKGLDVLLKAMPLILQELPDTTLHIAGEVYGDESIYRKLIADLGIKTRVIADFSYVKAEAIPHLFHKAALCILPYKSASQSGVIATAYQYGVPVLASDVGGLGEYVVEGKTGYLVPPDDPVALANIVIKHLINKPDMTADIRNYIHNYSWEALAKLFTAL